MRRKDPGRHSRNILWRGRAVRLALVSTALVTAIAAAQMSSKPDDGAMAQAITQQKVAAGEGAQPTVRRDKPLTTDQMLAAAASYEVDMRQAVAHGNASRVSAYRSKDIIRMTCVDDKINQMKTLVNMASTPMLMLRTFKDQPIVMREQFDVIGRAHERVSQLGAEVDACMGDNLDAVSAGKIQEEQEPTNINDPTRPPSPSVDIDRPPEASPYN